MSVLVLIENKTYSYYLKMNTQFFGILISWYDWTEKSILLKKTYIQWMEQTQMRTSLD